MKVVGLVTEYNPFHNGHQYHIEEAKRITGADYVIAVMSGNFVQRGTPAIIDKYSRTEMAINNGVDLVFELPVCYATASAEFFAHGAISLLDNLGIVDYLCFGSECGDITLMQEAARLLMEPPVFFEVTLQSYLRDGFTYPAARLKALEQYLSISCDPAKAHALSTILTEPNNILGIEYLKAIHRISSSLIPVTIQRKTAHYHDAKLSDHTMPFTKSSKVFINSAITTFESDVEKGTDSVISSATAIRNALQANEQKTEGQGLYLTERSVPNNVYQILYSKFHKTFPITVEDFSKIIKYKLLSEDRETLTRYVDITSDLADRMKNITNYDLSVTKLAQEIKTKNMTLTRINRALIHLLLNIQSDHFQEYNQSVSSAYARVLGLKKESSHLLRKITNNERIPVITKVSKANEQLDSHGRKMLSEDLFATHIYNQAVFEKYQTTIPNEYKHGICIL